MHKFNEIEDLETLHKEILTLSDVSSIKHYLKKLELFKPNVLNTELLKPAFSLLEKAIQSKNDIFLIQEIIEFINENNETQNLFPFLKALLENEQSIEYFENLINHKTKESFFRILKIEKDLGVLKNLAVVLGSFYEKFYKVCQVEEFDFLLESGQVFLRNAYLIIIYKHILICINQDCINKDSTINQYILIIIERTFDYHYLIRNKAISIIIELFELKCIPLKIRKEVLNNIQQRILDKTIIVRKKAISCFNSALMYHPFILNEGNLNYDEKNLNENFQFNENLNGNKNLNENENEYFKDLKIFLESLNLALKNVNILINTDPSNEIEEILELLKLCYFYNIKECILIYNNLFKIIQNKSELLEKTIISLCDLFLRKNKIDFFFEFEASNHLKVIIQLCCRRGFLKKEDFLKVFEKLKVCSVDGFNNPNSKTEVNDLNNQNNKFLKKGFYFLSCSSLLEKENLLEIINFINNKLFKSKNNEDLTFNVELYNLILDLILNYKDKGLNKNIIDRIIKDYIKMNFFDYSVSKKVIRLCFESGREYEENVKYLFKLLNNKNKNQLKVIYAVGCIAEEQGKLIDLIELRVKKLKGVIINKEDLLMNKENLLINNHKNNIKVNNNKESKVNNNKESKVNNKETRLNARRLSINASRLSFHGKVSDAIETENALEKIIKKPEDEILDILFYAKEKEIIYGNSMLKPFIPLILEGCNSNNSEILNISYLSLLKLFLISSEFFEENINLFFKGLKHEDFRIRNNCIITTRDLFLNYNFLLENHYNILFEILYDKNRIVRIHAIYIIFDLLLKNIIKIKNASLKLSLLLVDEDEEVKRISLVMFKKLVNSLVANIFYESLLYAKEKVKELVVVFLKIVGEKVKEVCFVKLMRIKGFSREVLKLYLENARFGEKFLEEMRMFEDFKGLEE